MSAVRKSSTTKKSATKKSTARRPRTPVKVTTVVEASVVAPLSRFQRLKARLANFRARRPHRSFRRTYRRDYTRSLTIPGYWAFTRDVQATLWRSRKLFLSVAAIYAILTATLVSLASEDAYQQIRQAIDSTSGGAFNGAWGQISKAGLLLAAGATGNFGSAQADTQGQSQIYAVFIGLLVWLTTVWLLRVLLTGRTPRMRDGLYNAGAPIVPTFMVSLVIVVQLLPVAFAVFAYNAAAASGLLDGGVEAMLFWSVAGLLTLLSLYWVTSTIMALVIVTLPGMYPMQALRTAGDLVIGRRVRILLRLLWMLGIVAVTWIVIAIPVILFDGWMKSAWAAGATLPLVPMTLLLLSALSVVWMASYVYLLYRKVVEDDALPA
jgi:hypothetical protein